MFVSVEEAGGKCLPCVVDIREEAQVIDAVKKAVEKFGGIDILVNNASAISLTGTEHTDMKRYDLMHSINTRGTFLVWVYTYSSLKHIYSISQVVTIRPVGWGSDILWLRDNGKKDLFLYVWSQ